MIRKIKVTDHPRLMEIWESAVLNTHDFLKEEDFLYYKEQLPVYFQHVFRACNCGIEYIMCNLLIYFFCNYNFYRIIFQALRLMN